MAGCGHAGHYGVIRRRASSRRAVAARARGAILRTPGPGAVWRWDEDTAMARAREVSSQQRVRGPMSSVSLRMLVLDPLGRGARPGARSCCRAFRLGLRPAAAARRSRWSPPRRRSTSPRAAAPPARARLGDREAALYLAYDMLQLGMLLFLTGGLQNPFAILMLAPVTVSATILSRRSVFWLSALTVAAISVLAVPSAAAVARRCRCVPPPLYVLGVWTALVSSTMFIAGYTWSVAEEARRMRDAFAATQLALAREQRISAVGALAAAAAHELGSPLGTIAVVAKELVRDLPADSPYAEDARCCSARASAAAPSSPSSRTSREERRRRALRRPAGLGAGRGGGRRSPARAASTSIYATARARRRAAARSRWCRAARRSSTGSATSSRTPSSSPGTRSASPPPGTKATVTVEIVDDGRASRRSCLARSASPISRRAAAARHEHMGLGIFIAQSLLERTGARLSFDNLADGGAQVRLNGNAPRSKAVARGTRGDSRATAE